MNEKFNKNAKVEKFTTMLGIAVRLTVIDPLQILLPCLVPYRKTRIVFVVEIYWQQYISGINCEKRQTLLFEIFVSF